jgi:hypothetical protein
MFAVMYRIYLKAGKETEFQKAWNIVARYFIEHRGALGSCLHKTEDGMWVAYSRWPDKEMRDNSWPGEDAPNEEFPSEVREAIFMLQECGDEDRKLPEICMEIADDQLLNN